AGDQFRLHRHVQLAGHRQYRRRSLQPDGNRESVVARCRTVA
ncbi:MAG: hypothetical protein JWL70_331, partial [Acidimicrobiia bacterium]|nr:hypothetical protein [Acidimicrobiia bacterium]